MPVYLTTGTPGAGKSLWTIATVEARRLKEGREVYYYNIKGLKLQWHALTLDQVMRWWELPTGAIIVIDEAQDIFPKGSTVGKPAEHADRIAKHRHGGFDIYLVSQHPMKLDANVRKDVEEHRHLMRKFGSHWVTVHLWKGVRDNCDKSRKDSIATQWRYPKQVFDWYESSEVHTVKRSVPWQVAVAFTVLPLTIGGLTWYIFWGRDMVRGQQAGTAAKSSVGPSAPSVQQGGSRPPGGAKEGYKAPQSAQAYYASYKPRIEGLPHTAPRYDELSAPVRVPVVVGCWQTESGKDGWCITQQGNRMRLPAQVMASFIENGSFHDFDEGPQPGESGRGGASPSSASPMRVPGQRGVQ